MRAIHQPRVNKLSDYLSRNHTDPTEWGLCKKVIQRLFQLRACPRYATHLRHHLPVWFCQIAYGMAAAKNALVQLWMGLFLYAFPLISIFELTLMKIRWRK